MWIYDQKGAFPVHPQLTANVWRTACLLFLFTAGCAARLPVTGTLPDNAAITEVIRVTVDAPFGLDPSAKRIAFGNGGLRIKEVGTAHELHVSPEEPTAVAWAPDGMQLAA